MIDDSVSQHISGYAAKQGKSLREAFRSNSLPPEIFIPAATAVEINQCWNGSLWNNLILHQSFYNFNKNVQKFQYFLFISVYFFWYMRKIACNLAEKRVLIQYFFYIKWKILTRNLCNKWKYMGKYILPANFSGRTVMLYDKDGAVAGRDTA